VRVIEWEIAHRDFHGSPDPTNTRKAAMAKGNNSQGKEKKKPKAAAKKSDKPDAKKPAAKK
jgi:hypothetical protein